MKNQQITYISPRLAILKVDPADKHQLLECQLLLRSRHKHYFHIFNLSSYQFPPSNLGAVTSTQFKWRQIPYSITQAIKILATLEAYQSINKANTAVIAVPDQSCFGFALFVVDLYWAILGLNNSALHPSKPHAFSEFSKLYKTINIQNPPVKIIDSFSFKLPELAFIPIIKIFCEGRHNYFEQIYVNGSQSQLMKYYIDKKGPLAEGVGQKFWDKAPETKHLGKPVVVFGDVKIQVFSYTYLKLQKQFTCGFNTKCLEYDQTLIQLAMDDLYELASPDQFRENQEIVIEISDYCEKCKDQAECQQCLEIAKKLGNTYHLAQLELEKLAKKRGTGEGSKIFG